jgi:hypothetical protein
MESHMRSVPEMAEEVDVAAGETTFVAEGFASDWLDDHTLIIQRFA